MSCLVGNVSLVPLHCRLDVWAPPPPKARSLVQNACPHFHLWRILAAPAPAPQVADVETLRTLFRDEGCTLQLHQPQRFVDPMWRLMAALEGSLGCLVGCNSYLTPAGTQGLAPHHDDVEIFVCQTKGAVQLEPRRMRRARFAAMRAPARLSQHAGAQRASSIAACSAWRVEGPMASRRPVVLGCSSGSSSSSSSSGHGCSTAEGCRAEWQGGHAGVHACILSRRPGLSDVHHVPSCLLRDRHQALARVRTVGWLPAAQGQQRRLSGGGEARACVHAWVDGCTGSMHAARDVAGTMEPASAHASMHGGAMCMNVDAPKPTVVAPWLVLHASTLSKVVCTAWAFQPVLRTGRMDGWAVDGAQPPCPAHTFHAPHTHTHASHRIARAQVIGQPVLDVEMKPGDVLYMPRGTIHQATAQSADSCHLTISTYQRWTYGDLLARVLAAAAQESGGCREVEDTAALSLPLALRKGLPHGHIFSVGLKVRGGRGGGSSGLCEGVLCSVLLGDAVSAARAVVAVLCGPHSCACTPLPSPPSAHRRTRRRAKTPPPCPWRVRWPPACAPSPTS